MPRLIKTIVLANAFEFYELSIYGYLSGILGQLFFQSNHPSLAVAQSFLLFAIGYLARPFGGLFFGILSDRISRVYSLRLSLIIMACATFLIGLLPTYNQVGGFATIGLLLARWMQSFSAGGELMGSSCYAFETAVPRSRGLSCSVVTASSAIGFLLGSLAAMLLFLCFNEQDRLTWAWRIPFVCSFPLAMVVYLIRKSFLPYALPTKKLPEVRPSYYTMLKQLLALKYPFIKALILVAYWEVAVYTLKIWMPAYLIYFIKVSMSIAQITNTVSLLLGALLTLFIGYLSDKWGYQRFLLVSIILLTVLLCPLFNICPAIHGVLFYCYKP